MLTAAQVRELGVAELFRELGYPVAPITITPDEWRRGGVEIGWNGASSFHLLARLRRFDLFHLRGEASEESVLKFLRAYRAYNVVTKSALIYEHENKLRIYDLSPKGKLRRLDVDRTAPSSHAVDRLNLLAAGDAPDKIFDLALDRESVSRRFFEHFRDAVAGVAAALPDRDADHALLVLSRLLFLSFVQEKGWLNAERRFLFDRLGTRGYYANVLRPLFFGCLNTAAADRDAAARALGRIPYLNGGLFEPSAYELLHPDLELPDELMQRVIAGVFERFDFSSDEADDAGTHVDPEMLGKVFESLMAEDERAASGNFYTPREIVDVLTDRAIRHWLGDGDLDRLAKITILDPACGSGAFLLSALTTIERIARELGGSFSRQEIVERSLYGVDVKPEAVRLCELRLWLAIVSAENVAIEDVPPLPNLDRNIMQGNSLLSPTDFLGDGRGDIYRQWVYALRAQSDLVERYRRAPGTERPALARLLRQNDRRLASDLLLGAIEADQRELEQLIAPHHDLFGRGIEPDAIRCDELQQRIATNGRALEDVEDGKLGFFSFDVHFAPVMAEGGFDVVAGNPPWVRNARIDTSTKRMLADRYALFRRSEDRLAFHQPDLSVAFFERATTLAAPGGVISMLMPAKILNAAYAAPLRRAAERLRIVAIDDWSGGDHFDADTFPLALTVAKRRDRRARIEVNDAGRVFSISQRDLSNGSEWALVPPEVLAIFKRLDVPPLHESLGRRPMMGVKSGDNRAFFLTDEEIAECRIPATAICRCVRGRDVRRWSVSASQWMLWPPAAGWKTPPRWLQRLSERRGIGNDWRLAFVRPEHVGIKVAWKDVSRGMSAVVLPDVVDGTIPLIPNQTLYFVDAVSMCEAYAICAVLNSTIADALLLAVAERAKDAHFRYFGRTVARMPFPRLDDRDVLVRLSRRAHRNGGIGEELDAAVAKLYGVDDSALATLRAFVDHRLAR